MTQDQKRTHWQQMCVKFQRGQIEPQGDIQKTEGLSYSD